MYSLNSLEYETIYGEYQSESTIERAKIVSKLDKVGKRRVCEDKGKLKSSCCRTDNLSNSATCCSTVRLRGHSFDYGTFTRLGMNPSV